MIIFVAAGSGRGTTELAAFDAALVAAGVADRNLIYLSSVLPPDSEVEPVNRIVCTPGGWGDRLYCVVARADAGCDGAQAWAGIGWAQDDSGRGLLVEHEAADEATLRATIDMSLSGMCRNRGARLPYRGMKVVGARCTGEPVCALAVAVFEAAVWRCAAVPARQWVPA